jgi:hypothetical protein
VSNRSIRGYPRNSGCARVDQDWYREPRYVTEQLLSAQEFEGEILDPCCGGGTIVSVCRDHGYTAYGSDIADRGFGAVRDLFAITEEIDNIVTNPPFRIAEKVVRHILRIVRHKAALIMPLTFVESRGRNALFRSGSLLCVYPCSVRPSMPPGVMNGQRDRHGALVQPRGNGGKAPYAWFIFCRGIRVIRKLDGSRCGTVTRTECRKRPCDNAMDRRGNCCGVSSAYVIKQSHRPAHGRQE